MNFYLRLRLRLRLVFLCVIVLVFLATNGFAGLRVHPSNPRYFTDSSGRAIYLGGHQIFVDLQDNTFDKAHTYGFRELLDWPQYIQFARARHLNYVRNWSGFTTGSASGVVATPMPYKRVSGSGNANDGHPKFDLYQFDQSYFDDMRSRAIDLRNSGIFLSIMLFDVYAFPAWGWKGNLFNSDNNINGIDSDDDHNGEGLEFFFSPSEEVRNLQKTYVEKVIATVGDLDNVMLEIANELGAHAWQVDMLNHVKDHGGIAMLSPGGLMADGVGYNSFSMNEALNSQADVLAMAPSWGDFANDPPINNTGRPAVIDMDHIATWWNVGSVSIDPHVPWRAFMRGYHYILYDAPFEAPDIESSAWELVRRSIGGTVTYANKVNLAALEPSTSISSTGYALANPGAEYLIYNPNSGAFTVSLAAGSYAYEWFNPNTAQVVETGVVNANTESMSFSPPFSDESVLYLRAPGSTSTSTYPSPTSAGGDWIYASEGGYCIFSGTDQRVLSSHSTT